ncbi:ubiquitin-conjugating enzyme E2 J1 isoform X2 [Athene cunicularia]|uniref:ubiquitin-conjugating enzyme E2 J1 isoform X2 n=1 Tax=Athene cunicularia TaxID=194338 RepID=UPI000EF6998E|nr:ubiquitin-conjugating enzyme E2 J1 isoform X2 [Athene cunicularia]
MAVLGQRLFAGSAGLHLLGAAGAAGGRSLLKQNLFHSFCQTFDERGCRTEGSYRSLSCTAFGVRTALLAIIGFMPTKGEGAIGSLDYTPEERRALAKKSQDFCCEMCGTSMKTALLPLTSGSGSSQADKEAKELARQISFKAEVNTSRKSDSGPSNLSGLNHSAASREPQQDGAARAFQDPTSATSETQNSSAVASQEHAPPVSTNTSMSPRQRRAQQQSQRRAPSSTEFNRVQQPRVNTNHTGSTVLIVLLTFALAVLIFRRIYLANEYIFEL